MAGVAVPRRLAASHRAQDVRLGEVDGADEAEARRTLQHRHACKHTVGGLARRDASPLLQDDAHDVHRRLSLAQHTADKAHHLRRKQGSTAQRSHTPHFIVQYSALLQHRHDGRARTSVSEARHNA
jgi:hypothetical protein